MSQHRFRFRAWLVRNRLLLLPAMLMTGLIVCGLLWVALPSSTFLRDTVPAVKPSENQPGGGATVTTLAFPSFMQPAPNMTQAQRLRFFAGKALAHQPWIKAPATTIARDGLGPIYNANACLACHVNGGRGHLPNDSTTPLTSALVRISVPGSDSHHGVVADAVYGDQLQTRSLAVEQFLAGSGADALPASVASEAPAEAAITVFWLYKTVVYPDHEQRKLRYPQLHIQQLAYGALAANTLFSLRNAPPIHGVGLLEAIRQQDINALADPDDRNDDGISGRVNQVWDVVSQQTVPGRFGLKANKPHLLAIIAGAFSNDLGISNPLFPTQPCTAQQIMCLQTANGNDAEGVELPQHLLNLAQHFTQNLGVPARRHVNDAEVLTGRRAFYAAACQACHQPTFVTGTMADEPQLSGQTIWPYTDLLLHDMGAELADGRPDFQASGSEWRTPPLWGVGLGKAVNGSSALLHDGRATSVEEAILWHGGEAVSARNYFMHLSKVERQALIRFVESL